MVGGGREGNGEGGGRLKRQETCYPKKQTWHTVKGPRSPPTHSLTDGVLKNCLHVVRTSSHFPSSTEDFNPFF